MITISYGSALAVITCLWVILRTAVCLRLRRFSLKQELKLLPVYICIMVVTRFTFFPFSRVNGQIQPLLFDFAKSFPPRINLLPVVHLLDYPVFREALVNVIGNTALFLPLGIVWPMAFRQLDTHKKVIAAGVGYSLVIELLQLPFFDRVSDIDDLLLNSLGFLMGYGIYLLAKKLRQLYRRFRGK